MPRFVARHHHSPGACPARDPVAGPGLLAHLDEASARRHGVRIHGDAVLDGQHTLYLIVEADNQAKVEAYLQPFAQAGEVEVWPASTCEAVVTRKAC